MIDDVDDTFCYSIGQNTTEIGSNLSEFQWVDQDFEGHLWRFAGAYKQVKGKTIRIEEMIMMMDIILIVHVTIVCVVVLFLIVIA